MSALPTISTDRMTAEERLAALYDAHAERLHAVARRLLRSPADAEECVQEVFVQLALRLGRGKIDDPAAYLFSSLRNGALARLRETAKRDALGLRLVTSDEDARDPIPRDPLQSRALAAAIEALPLEQREVLALKIDGDLTFAQIAECLGISLNTAASRYRYALEKLKAALLPRGSGPGFDEEAP